MNDRRQAECPRCGYDLSGLIASWTDSCPLTGVCSECGLNVRYAEVLNPALTVPPWSYEHAGARLLRRLASTCARSCRPLRFWSALRLEHPHRPGRLLAALAALFLLTHLASNVLLSGTELVRYADVALAGAPKDWVRPALLFLWPYHFLTFPGRPATGIEFDPWCALLLLWAALAPAFVLVLPQTLRMCRIRRGHLLRVLVFTLPVPILITLLWYAVSAWCHAQHRRTPLAPWRINAARALMDQSPCIALLALAWMALCWWAVTTRYLRLPRPTMVAAAIVIMSGMTATAIAAYWPGSLLISDFGKWLWVP